MAAEILPIFLREIVVYSLTQLQRRGSWDMPKKIPLENVKRDCVFYVLERIIRFLLRLSRSLRLRFLLRLSRSLSHSLRIRFLLRLSRSLSL